jgi:hypothetical protein
VGGGEASRRTPTDRESEAMGENKGRCNSNADD